MCYYITAVLSPKADVATVETIAKSHHRNWESLPNHSLQQILREGETYYLTTRGICDCGTNLGAFSEGSRREPDYTRNLKRFRKKRWSEAKIERWLSEKLKNVTSRNNYLTNPPDDIVHWNDFLHEVFDARAAKAIGLVVHFYHGVIETEQITITDRRWNSINDLDHEYLLQAEADVIHTFQASVQ